MQVLRTREAELRAMGLGSGEVTNLVTVDVNRMCDAASSFNQFWSLPIQARGTQSTNSSTLYVGAGRDEAGSM